MVKLKSISICIVILTIIIMAKHVYTPKITQSRIYCPFHHISLMVDSYKIHESGGIVAEKGNMSYYFGPDVGCMATSMKNVINIR